MQREENQLPLAAPTESQISEKLHFIKHKQTLSFVSLNRTSDTLVSAHMRSMLGNLSFPL